LTEFFSRRGFTQTHPPILTSSDCEGAGEAFTVVADAAESRKPPGNKSKTSDHFFRSPKYLTVSTQLHLEAMAQAVGNVWSLSPTFRAEKSDTSRHLSEFYMLEAEISFVDEMDKVMDFLEDMLRSLVHSLSSTAAAREVQVRSEGDNGGRRTLEDDLVPAEVVRRRWEGMMEPSKWPRITYTEAISILKREAHRFEHQPVWGAGLQSEHERFLAETIGTNEAGNHVPVFVTNYPRDIKAFYMRTSAAELGTVSTTPERQITVDCFDLLVPDLCEIAGGSMREHRLEELRNSMQRQNMTSANLDWYVDLRRWGSPPHGGYGLGFDRLLSYLSGVQTVRDIVTFPRWHGRCDC
jgi:asparaginyl-tRNA synthetase